MEHIVEQCNLELLLYMHFFIRHLFPCFHRKVNFDENRNLPKSCNCVQKYCMEKNIEDSRQNFFFLFQATKFRLSMSLVFLARKFFSVNF